MIRTFTAYTGEIDDTEAAVSEILGQLDNGGSLLKNTVGILTCYSDFVEPGTVREICAALPFEVIGSTTLANATPGASGALQLTLLVITSDDVSFSVGLTDQIKSQDNAPIYKAYGEASPKLDGHPALIIGFAPLLVNVSGDFFVNSFSKVSSGVPFFGMISVDHNSDYHEASIIYNGESYLDRCAFVILSGKANPRFFMGSISVSKVFNEKGVVTASMGNQLQTVNGKPVVDYLLSIGLTKDEDGTIIGINSFPLIVDYNDGTTPVVRAVFANTPEGYAVCGGDIPVGATLSVGTIDMNEIIATATGALKSALASKPDCILIFSCVGRYFYMGYEPMREIEEAKGILDPSGLPYQITYSGGEFCPVYSGNKEGQIINRNHNDTIVICTL